MSAVETATDADLAVTPFALDAIGLAVQYRRWMVSRLAPHCGSVVLELGAGIGNLSPLLPGERLILTEPDPTMLSRLNAVARGPQMEGRSVRVDAFDPTQDDGAAFHDEAIDTVVSANVLEHIHDHVGAIATLRRLLDVTAPGRLKRIVTLVPAHPLAYGRVDLAMGHHRRYTARNLREVHRTAVPGAEVAIEGFNVVGLAGWFARGRILRRTSIEASTVETVERILPAMRLADRVVRTIVPRPIGQSLIGVASWR
ncbi:MAG TPA: class I SAM-dependent methyltransferase [Conexibacter sp.]|nr:class I SAM-dependent methyltransferase [Conexibacter sp.]